MRSILLLVAAAVSSGAVVPVEPARPASPMAVETTSALASRAEPDEATLSATIRPLDDPPDELPVTDASMAEHQPPVASVLSEVRWTVDKRSRIEEVATNWGMWPDTLRELNPELGDAGWLEPGRSFVVHRDDPRRPTQSVGAPNRGRLLAGIPLPEGPAWQLRVHRPRAFGSRTTITALLAAFERYSERDPLAPPVRVGEISRRSGGRIAPHVSHRTGRDVDIGYVLNPHATEQTERYWPVANAKTFDAPRTWALIEALIETGKVQQIFVSMQLQPLLIREAAKTRTPEALARLFSVANADPKQPTLIKHEHGHRDHLHVRFVCEEGNVRCRARSVDLRADAP